MTRATELVTVSPEMQVSAADALAAEKDVSHLLVVEDGCLVGIVSRCDLLPELDGQTVRERMPPTCWAVEAAAPLGEAAGLMIGLGISCLPVLARHLVCGVITRSDLLQLGIPDEDLGGLTCVACGSSRSVCDHPRLDGISFCLDCIQRSNEPIDYDELGIGD